jgi:hypothetical protein
MEHCLHSYTARLLFVINTNFKDIFFLYVSPIRLNRVKIGLLQLALCFFRDTFLRTVQTYEICVYHSGVAED